MAIKIRLRQQGRKNRPFYRLVASDCRSPRDGKYLEALGWYNPFETEDEKALSIDANRIQHWLDLGAQLTDSAEALVLKGAPSVIRWLSEKQQAHRSKVTVKRREARRRASANRASAKQAAAK